jgi:hypothetical protein
VIGGFEPVLEMNLVPIGTNEFFPELVRLVANERHGGPTRKPSEIGKTQSGVSTQLFLSFTPRSFPTGIRDGDRRELREPRPCSLGRRNVCRALAAVRIPRQVQESRVRSSSVGAPGCSASPTLPGFCADVSRLAKSRNPNTHGVCFPLIARSRPLSWNLHTPIAA